MNRRTKLHISVNLTLSATAIQSHSSFIVSEVTKLSSDVINKSYDVIANSLNNTRVYSVLEISEELYPADIDGTIYTIVLVIQVRILAFFKIEKLAIHSDLIF